MALLHQRDTPAPSASTITRMRLLVDGTYMLTFRHMVQQFRAQEDDLVMAFLADASPQGGREWLLIEAKYCRSSSLAGLARRHDECINADQATKKAELDTELHGLLRHHVFPPMAFGTRAMDYEHKLVATLQSLSLDLGSSLLQVYTLALMGALTLVAVIELL